MTSNQKKSLTFNGHDEIDAAIDRWKKGEEATAAFLAQTAVDYALSLETVKRLYQTVGNEFYLKLEEEIKKQS